MRDLSELNINEGGKPVQRPAPTEHVVEAFERHFGIILPHDYLRLLRHSNGGHPQLDSIEPIFRPGAAQWSVHWFYHLDADRQSAYGLWVATELWQPILGKHALPFAEDGGGNQFFFDLRTSPIMIKVCVHDDRYSVLDIAPSFEAFINALFLDADMI